MTRSMIQAYRRFGGAYCRHIQGRRVSQGISKHAESTVSTCLLLAWLLFDSEDGKIMLLRNVYNLLSDCTASYLVKLFRVNFMKFLSCPPDYLVLFVLIFIMSVFRDHTISILFCHVATLRFRN
jgi:hypothetical protein